MRLFPRYLLKHLQLKQSRDILLKSKYLSDGIKDNVEHNSSINMSQYYIPPILSSCRV